MKQLISSKTGLTWGLIDDASLAALLTDPESFRYFVPFLGQPLTAAQAARQAGARVDTTLYRIKTFLGAGLLEVLPGPSPRARKRYQSVAERFVVPFDATRFDTLVELFLSHDAPSQRAFARALVGAVGDRTGWTLRIHRDRVVQGRVVTVDAAPAGDLDWDMRSMLAPDAPATWFTSQNLTVDAPTAKALQRDLLALFQKYEALAAQVRDPGAPHLLQLQLAPLAATLPTGTA